MLSSVVLLVLIGFCVGEHIKGTTLFRRPSRYRCPLGFTRYKWSCYLFSRNTGTYAEALSFCRYFGSRLAQIDSRREEDFIRGHLKRKGGGVSYYIDGTDLRVEGIWTWERPQLRKIPYLNWKRGQPDNNKGREHCLHLKSSYWYTMNDCPCESKYRFVCEK